MPIPSKVSTNRQAQTRFKTSLLSRAKPVTEHDSGGIHMSLYGNGKTGKTRFLSTFPKPLLIVGAEDGTKSIKGREGIDFIKVILKGGAEDKSRNTDGCIYLDQLSDLIEEVRSSHYQSVGVDTASALQELMMANILGLEELPAQKSWGMASRDQWGQCSLKMKTTLREFLKLSCHVVIIAHERSFGDDNESDLIAPTVGSALSPAVTGWLNGAVDYICQTCKVRRKKEVQVQVGNKTKTRIVDTDQIDYCLRVGPHLVYQTGFRVDEDVVLPDLIVNPTYDKIAELIG